MLVENQDFMKDILRKLCWPILSFFETGGASANYKKSHRLVLIVVGSLFFFLSAFSASMAYAGGELAALIPVIVFFCVGLVAVVVGALGSNGAVSKIWGTK